MQFKNLCQWRWKLDYLDGNRSKIYSVHMDFGTAIHGAIEQYRSSKPNPYVTIEVTVFFFKQYFKYLYDKNKEHYTKKDFNSPFSFFTDAGENILLKLDECDEITNAKVVYNEYMLNTDIDRSDDINIRFKGYIDFVIKTKDKRGKTILYVIDFKTCSWGWGNDKKQDKNLHFQILLYKHFLCKTFGLDPKNVRTAFVLLKKKPSGNSPPVEFFPISAGPISVQRAVDELNKSISEMSSRLKSNSLIKNTNNCISDYGDRCPYLDTNLCTKDT